MRDVFFYIAFFLIAIYGIYSIKKIIKHQKMSFNPSEDLNLNDLSDKKKDRILENEVFSKMTKEQKYAYIYTIEAFLSFADNALDDNENTLEGAELQNIFSLYNYTLELLDLKEEDIDDAIAYFDSNFIITPIEYLKKIEDHIITDSLLFVCYQIVETKRGQSNGQDINKLANEFFRDYFGNLDYSSERIDETISKIKRF